MDKQKLGPSKAPKNKLPKKKSQPVAQKKRRSLADFVGTLDDSSSHIGGEVGGFLSEQNRVSVSLDLRSSEELSGLKEKLQIELISVRNLMKKIERCSGKMMLVDNGVSAGSLKRVHSEVGSVDVSDGKERVIAGDEITPFQEKLGVTLSDERGSVSVQAKKSKASKKKSRDESASVSGMENSSSKVFKSCSSLLNKLMKTKGGWLFNEPVDVEGLGLDDYLAIIKHPMDLGTVKSRLTTNQYKTPQEFAGDVRLTFQNAMTYNTEGHEINTLAKQFLKVFEDRWVVIEADYSRQLNKTVDSEARVSSLPTEPPLIAPSLPPPSDVMEVVDRSEAKSISVVAAGKTRLPKPKAKDPQKREMTLEEKEKLSASLQNLPPEKLEGVVSIIKKRNPSLSQKDDEIEVDIDTVDTETLWELDRFVIYYKKALSKMRRSAKLAQIGVVAEPNLHEKNKADFGIVEAKENEADEKNIFSSASNEGEQEVGNATLSGGSSSSSSDSGSSSSESDTDSSSS